MLGWMAGHTVLGLGSWCALRSFGPWKCVASSAPFLLQLAHHRVRDRDRAEEVVQDMWVDFIRSLPRFEGLCSEMTWLVQILKRCIQKAQRPTTLTRAREALSGILGRGRDESNALSAGNRQQRLTEDKLASAQRDLAAVQALLKEEVAKEAGVAQPAGQETGTRGIANVSPPTKSPVDKRTVAEIIERGGEYLDQGQYAMAIEQLQRGLKLDPHNVVLRELVKRARAAHAAERANGIPQR
jgi:tetratricopeptide (TPR) repeat protein